MPAPPDWPHLVTRHARATGAPDLPPHAVEEIAAHLEDIYLARRAAGESEATARATALEALRESPLSEVKGFRPRTGTGPSRLSAGHALRSALRQFRTQRAFALLAVLVLGLGSGASAVVYTVVDRVVLRPLPYAAPDRLVSLWDTNAARGLAHEPISPVNFMDDRALPVFTDAAAWWRPDVNLVDAAMDPLRVRTIETGANLFDVLGVAPEIGPGFPKGGPLYSSDLLAVISDRLWRSRYQADPGIIGRPLSLNGSAYTVVGVMPPRFDFPGEIDVWERSRWDFRQHSRGAHFMEAVARLAPGVDLARATAETDTLASRLQHDFASTNRGWGVRLVPLLDDQLGYYRPALVVLFAAVALLMLISCLNVASLLLTRAVSREREMAVRTALGASRRQLVVQLLAEGGVLALAGAGAGVLAAAAALPLVVAATPVEIPRLAEVALDGRVLLFALGLAAVTTVVFGLVPAVTVRGRALTAGLKSGDRSVSRASRALYRVLVAGEVALAGALLVASSLLVRTVGRMMDVPTGVGRPSAVIASLQLSGPAYTGWPDVSATYDAILDDIRAQPGVRAAGASNILPLDPGWRLPFGIEGQPALREGEAPQAQHHTVTEGYFQALGVGLRGGRFFDARDTRDSTAVAIVNETFAHRYLERGPGAEHVLTTAVTGVGPLGRNLVGARFTIVGVVADVKDVPMAQPNEPAVYFPARQFPFRAMYVAVDAADTPTAVAAIRSALKASAPGTPLEDARTWAARYRARTAEPRLLMTVLVAFGALAAVLAALGVYGLFSWMVALRKRELAIRLTLGARPMSLCAIVLRQGLSLAAGGMAVGWLVVRGGEHALARVLFEVSPGDLASALTAAAVLLAASLAACLPPALRAMRVDPVDGLRVD